VMLIYSQSTKQNRTKFIANVFRTIYIIWKQQQHIHILHYTWFKKERRQFLGKGG